jgi:hypothetical protein
LAGVSQWKFGDGDAARGTEVSHLYEQVGRFTVTFTQPDARGDVSTATTTVLVVARVRIVRRPSIVGVARVGHALRCVRGSWTGSPPIRYAYGWRRNGHLIAGADMFRYRLDPRDAGSRVSCEVVATNAGGSARATSAAVGIRR